MSKCQLIDLLCPFDTKVVSGTVTGSLSKWTEKTELERSIGMLEKPCLL